ncbi:MAG TPA: threonine synthase [Dokdonella sp.]|nr:threonine synthase [Dokdonella sp.]
MTYVSTRGHAPAIGLGAALVAGLAPDGGLYVPASLPSFDIADFDGCDTLPGVAARLLRPFFAGDALADELDAICAEALDIPAPLRAIGADAWLLELFHGPTAAFKDFAARFLAACFARLRAHEQEPPVLTDVIPAQAGIHGALSQAASMDARLRGHDVRVAPHVSASDGAASRVPASVDALHVADAVAPPFPIRTVLVATSGDTGAAVAAAFHRRPGFRVVILYPDGRVSPRQAHQLGAFGYNVLALRAAGSFDDCQALVKSALGDDALKARVPLASANSISLGRLLPQMAYYALAALQRHRIGGAPPTFVVPTGNLGNAFAAILARACGLPIGDVVLATNANRTLPDFFAGADYTPRASVATLANAMDVGAPSNFERLRWLYPDDADLRRAVSAAAVDDATIRATLRAYAERGLVVCPHTATALHVLDRRRAAGNRADTIVVATAHPAKFDTIIEPLLGHPVDVPPALAALLARPADAEPLAATYEALAARLNALDA